MTARPLPCGALVFLHTLAFALAAASLPAQGNGFFLQRPAMGLPRQELGCAELGGFGYAAGGFSSRVPVASVERFDPAARTWTPVAPMPTTLHHFGCAAANGRLYVIGGYVSAFTGTDAVHAYDPASNQWSTVQPLPQARGALAAVTIGGRIFAVGGVHPTRGVVGDLTVYDPLANAWATLPPMPTPREHLGAAVLDGMLWVCGGRVGFGAERRTVEVYDPVANSWSARPDLPVAHGGTGAAVLRGRLLVFGGEGPGGNVAEVDEWDPGRGSWRRVADLPVPVHGIYPVTLGDEILVAGGGTAPGFASTDLVQAFSYLPDGVRAYGRSTHCGRPVWLGTSAPPRVGQTGFAFVTSPDLPPLAFGLLALAPTPDPAGTPILGAPVFVSVGPTTVAVVVAADPAGVAMLRGPDPMPAALVGHTFYLQGGWAPPNPCVQLLTSDAIEVTVR